MKKLLTIALGLMLSFGSLQAQDIFQGTIQYDMEMKGEGLEGMEAMLPTGMELKVRKSDVRMEIQGGMVAMMMGPILTKGKKGEAYMIKDSEETIYIMSQDKEEGENEAGPEPKITKEDEVITIAGYECQKYKVTVDGPSGEVTQYVWATDQLEMPKMKSGGVSGMGSSISMKGIPGMMMKAMSSQGPMTVIITAKTVDTTMPDKADFKLPKGYDKQEFDANAMMGGMGM